MKKVSVKAIYETLYHEAVQVDIIGKTDNQPCEYLIEVTKDSTTFKKGWLLTTSSLFLWKTHKFVGIAGACWEGKPDVSTVPVLTTEEIKEKYREVEERANETPV